MSTDEIDEAIENFMAQLMPGALYGLVVSGVRDDIEDHFITGHKGCTPQQVRALLVAGIADLDNFIAGGG